MEKQMELGREYDKDGNYIGPVLLPPIVRQGRPDLEFERDLNSEKLKRGESRV